MDLEQELVKYIGKNHQNSPVAAIKFLINAWNSSSLESSDKYEVILRYFVQNLFNELLNIDAICEVKEVLDLRFPPNSVSNDFMKLFIKKQLSNVVQNERKTSSIEISLSVISNESYKEYFKNNLITYCKLIGSSLTCFDELKCNNLELLDEIIRELHYFAKSKDFQQHFGQHVLVPLHKASSLEKNEKINDMWSLIKSIFFSRSYEDNSSIKFLSDKEITIEQMEVLTESFIISFKSELPEIVKLFNHFNEDVLSKYENNNAVYLNHVKILYSLLKKHQIEIAALKKLQSSLDDFSSAVLDRVKNSIEDMNLCEYFHVLSTIISYDPFLFVDDNTVYKLLVECMMKEKSESDMPQYEVLLATVVKIFGKDINQFIKKLLSAIDWKFENFVIPKKRKRKITNESESSFSKKKVKLNDGSSFTADTYHITNIWPNSIKLVIDEIFADINVNQTTKLWSILNNSLRIIIESLTEGINENILFKIDFISSLICQLVTSSRIHEHLVYKSSEISTAIEDFNDVQHNFYETIINIEYNNRIMNAFLKMSYDYENFIMMYFYHYEEQDKSELDPIFIADKSRIKSGEWKIIQQRIKNFGKVEEKSYSNLLMIQHIIKGKLFRIANYENDNDFLHNLIQDKEQINLLLEHKDARLHIFNLLNDECNVSSLIESLYSKIKDDKEKVSVVLNLAKTNSKMLELFLNLTLKNRTKNDENSLEIIKQLPIAFLSHESKKIVIEKLLLDVEPKNHSDLIIIFNKIFKNDGYKTFFKDFTMNSLVERSFSDVNKFRSIYELIIRTSIKRMTLDVLKNVEWIIKEGNSIELIEILAKSLCEVNVAPTNECKLEKINDFKLDVIGHIASKLNESNIVKEQQLFCSFSRLCCQNMQILKDETKEKHLNLLNKLLKSLAKTSASDGTIEMFMFTLKDAKKLNLDDEIKAGIVKNLTKHMYSIIEETLIKEVEEVDKHKDVTRERELIATLSTFKNNCREECSQYLFKKLNGNDTVKDKQLIYSLKIYEILFENFEKTEKKENTGLVKSYMKHIDNFVVIRGNITEIDILCAIYSSHIAMLKCYKEKLDFLVIDEIFAFHIDSKNRPFTENVEDFCKFYENVGQFLFVLGNFHQNYFKSRIPQYFKAYNKFLDTIYYYKADDKEEFDAKESSMLLRLTLQLENIMKMLMKLHSNSFSIISPYIVSSIVNLFIKPPKMLNVGDKFKVNIRNICYQLLSTFDDKTRKHICALVDESTRDVYDCLFKELKRK